MTSLGSLKRSDLQHCAHMAGSPKMFQALVDRKVALPRRLDVIVCAETASETLLHHLKDDDRDVRVTSVQTVAKQSPTIPGLTRAIVPTWQVVLDRLMGGRYGDIPRLFPETYHPLAPMIDTLGSALEVSGYLQIGYGDGHLFGDITLGPRTVLDTEFKTAPTPHAYLPNMAFDLAPEQYFAVARHFDPVHLVCVHGACQDRDILRWLTASQTVLPKTAVWILDHGLAGEQKGSVRSAAFIKRLTEKLPLFRSATLMGEAGPVTAIWLHPKLGAISEQSAGSAQPEQSVDLETLTSEIIQSRRQVAWSQKRTLEDRAYLIRGAM